MRDDQKIGTRFSGGLLGVISLAIIGGAAGWLGYSTLGDDDTREIDLPVLPSIDAMADSTIDIIDVPGARDPSESETPDERVDGPGRMPAEGETSTEDRPEPPRPEPPPTLETTPPAPAVPDRQILKQAAFIVRFNTSEETDAFIATFRKDKAASKAAFAKWAAGNPAFDGMTLERVNYSGEAILSYSGAEDANPVRSAKEIKARISAQETVRYADPDFTAFPGKGD